MVNDYSPLSVKYRSTVLFAQKQLGYDEEHRIVMLNATLTWTTVFI